MQKKSFGSFMGARDQDVAVIIKKKFWKVCNIHSDQTRKDSRINHVQDSAEQKPEGRKL